jgi:hypothetical protein
MAPLPIKENSYARATKQNHAILTKAKYVPALAQVLGMILPKPAQSQGIPPKHAPKKTGP